MRPKFSPFLSYRCGVNPFKRRTGRVSSKASLSPTSIMLLTLPQETLNEIIGHLRSEERTLRSLSLVDRRLTEECRCYLFWSVRIDSEEKLHRWCDTISPGQDGLSRHVRLLDIGASPWGSLCTPSVLRDHMDHLRSFTKLGHLSIRTFNPSSFSSQDLKYCFGNFSTIRSIAIWPKGDWRAILDFLTLFPLLETTTIAQPHIWGNPEGVDPPDFVRRGELILHAGWINGYDKLFSYLSRPTTRYWRLRLTRTTVEDCSALKEYFETCGGSLETLQLINCTFCECQLPLLVSSY